MSKSKRISLTKKITKNYESTDGLPAVANNKRRFWDPSEYSLEFNGDNVPALIQRAKNCVFNEQARLTHASSLILNVLSSSSIEEERKATIATTLVEAYEDGDSILEVTKWINLYLRDQLMIKN